MLPDLKDLNLAPATPGLHDLLENLTPLRSEHPAELENDLMMAVLGHSGWFLAYRVRLNVYRGGGAPPQYPSDRVEAVEKAVDSLIRLSIDPDYKR